jgi:hypothetical protein
LEYTVEVGRTIDQIILRATANHSKATVDGDGTQNLNPGNNEFKSDGNSAAIEQPNNTSPRQYF